MITADHVADALGERDAASGLTGLMAELVSEHPQEARTTRKTAS